MDVKTGRKLSRGMLCDEMGLGKTVEAMSLVATRPVDKTLIIVPPILIHQWMEWIHKLDPKARVYNIRPRDDHQWDIELDLLQKSKIVITGYMKLLGTRSERVKQNLTGLRKEKSPIHDIYWDQLLWMNVIIFNLVLVNELVLFLAYGVIIVGD